MSKRCKIKFRRGWKCLANEHVDGPCALVPRWWNIIDQIRYWRLLHG